MLTLAIQKQNRRQMLSNAKSPDVMQCCLSVHSRRCLNTGGIQTYFLWLSVSVMPCEDTLKCTTVAVGGEAAASVSDMALATA